jgi:acetyl-CoA carboxylase biotin carboxyl carrier protein
VTGLSPEDTEALMLLFEASDWHRLDLVIGDVELHLSKSDCPRSDSIAPLAPPAAPPPERSAPATSLGEAPARSSDSAAEDPVGWIAIRAPHLGTFYRAPKPGAAAYIEVGQKVNADTEVCLLEVMKLFTTLRAGVSGVIRKVCMTDSSLVESGQVLFLVDPEA